MYNTGDHYAYHFRVTCPFWTRFILKPTVGIELLKMIWLEVGLMEHPQLGKALQRSKLTLS